MTYSNAEILAAILNRFAQPIVMQFAGQRMASMPFVQMLENKVRSWGIVSQGWSLTHEIAPFIEPVTRQALTPILKNYLANVPDEAIPAMAHSLVDKGIEQGGISLMEGRLQLEKTDLEELKKLLDYNMPLKQEMQGYQVITEDPNHGAGNTEVGEQSV